MLDLEEFAEKVHENARNKGFWDTERSENETFNLISCEIAELVEALRNGNPESEKIPGFTAAEEELADIVIRCLDAVEGHESLTENEYDGKGRPFDAQEMIHRMFGQSADHSARWTILYAMAFAALGGHRIAEAIKAKHEYNLTRPHLHGKRF